MAKNNDNSKRIAIQLQGFIAKEIIALSFNIHYDLVEDTPKDTGFAASNWVPQIGSRYSELVDNYSYQGTSAIQKQGEISLLSYKVLNGPIYITNNVKYIQKLNAGHSTQAPAMFVEKIIQKRLNQAIRDKQNKGNK